MANSLIDSLFWSRPLPPFLTPLNFFPLPSDALLFFILSVLVKMFKASTPLKETQAHVASPLSIKAQNAQESKSWELIIHACKALRAIYVG